MSGLAFLQENVIRIAHLRTLDALVVLEALADALHTTQAGALRAASHFAFTHVAFARNPHPETWEPGPGRRCVFCRAPVFRSHPSLCAFHAREQERLGILGDWQYHRMCVGGLDTHKPCSTRDKHGVPRCVLCGKSLIHIDPGAIAKHRRGALRRTLYEAGRYTGE